LYHEIQSMPPENKPDDTSNPWTTLKSEWVYETPWIRVQRHEVLNPAGNPGVYSTVHFRNKAIGILPLDDDFNTWLVGQYRYPLGSYSWEIPEGGGALDVPLEISARRELQEETGISAVEFIPLLRMHLSNSVSDEEAIVFIAKGLSFGEPAPEETEVLQVRKLHLLEAYEMVLREEITDSITVAALMKAYIMLKEGLL